MIEKIKKLITKANNGNSEAQADLAWMYYRGVGVKKSYRKAFFWNVKDVLKTNSPLVCRNIANMYEFGMGVEKNEKKAFLWALRSAKQKYPLAMAWIAWYYLNGVGTEKSYANAKIWYNKILEIEPKNSSALFSLGNIAYLEKDYKTAFYYFTEAFSIDKHPRSAGFLARMYAWGIGCEADLENAKKCMQIARRSKNVYGIERLAKSKRWKVQLEKLKKACSCCLKTHPTTPASVVSDAEPEKSPH